ncbi:MAG: hypothetical protein KAH32_07100 [Chlamydiia bacterium]|nr:hypothetical protein [Chlamydiia bacterium]
MHNKFNHALAGLKPSRSTFSYIKDALISGTLRFSTMLIFFVVASIIVKKVYEAIDRYSSKKPYTVIKGGILKRAASKKYTKMPSRSNTLREASKGPVKKNSLRKAPKVSVKEKPASEQPLELFYSLQNAKRRGSMFNVDKPDHISDILNTIKYDGISENEGFSNLETLGHWAPTDIVMYGCMLIADIAIQENLALQYKDTTKSKDKDLQENDLKTKKTDPGRNLDHVSKMLIQTVKGHKLEIQKSMSEINKSSLEALSKIKGSYESTLNLNTDPDLEYEREFLKNLNIVLYMISKEDLSNINDSLIENVKSHLSSYLSSKAYSLESENKDFSDRDSAYTEQESKEQFLKTFEEITRSKK